MANRSTKTKTPKSTPPEGYIAYLTTMERLAERLNATPEEMAAWIFMRTKADRLNRTEQTPAELEHLAQMGQKDYGLAAYLHDNELDPPPRFYYNIYSGPERFDYLSPLTACSFREDDIKTFEPAERYITCKALIERWSTRLHNQTKAYIEARITKSQLASIHPIYGVTQGIFSADANSGDAILPPLESGLFALSAVKDIEAEDFGEKDVPRESSASPYRPARAGEIPHPNDLAHVVRATVGSPKPGSFESMTTALESWFDKVLADLPGDKRKRVERDFPFPGCWDAMSADQRRSGCEQWDYYNDPALEEKRAVDWELASVDWVYWQQVLSLTTKEFCILRYVYDPRTFEADQNSVPGLENKMISEYPHGTPGSEKKTLGELVSDDMRIIERSLDLDVKKPVQEWVLWAQEQGWGIPSYLCAVTTTDTASEQEGANLGPCSVTANKIKSAFRIPNVRDSDAWWDERMRDAKRYELTECRASKGLGKRPSLWRPDLIAAWLVDRKHMPVKNVGAILRHVFPDCAETADLLDPPSAG